MAAPVRARLTGWTVFAALMIILAGADGILTGLWAFDNDNSKIDTFVFENEITTWGWVYLIAGIILILAGISVLNGREWGRVIGILAAALWVIIRLPWIWTYPVQVFISVLLGVVVIYGLSVYGHERS
ncbi:MAG: DUF7144 family membrane protein [Acidimicrobiia bacterium]